MELDELKIFYKHIKRDFSRGEYAPYSVLHRQLQENIQEGLVFCEGKEDIAYSICAADNADGYVLISLFAVFDEYRGRGIGSAFIKALCTMYNQKQAILLEVERPELSQSQEEYDTRKRRIGFYEKAGFYLVPEVDYTIWGVPMHLMALPLVASKDIINQKIGEVMHQIYLKLMGEQLIHKMRFAKIKR